MTTLTKFKTAEQIEKEAVAAARTMTVVGEYHTAYATAWSMAEVVADAARRCENFTGSDAERDVAVAVLDLRAFEGDVQDFFSAADNKGRLGIIEDDVKTALANAVADNNEDANMDVTVYAVARINGGYKWVPVDSVRINLAAQK